MNNFEKVLFIIYYYLYHVTTHFREKVTSINFLKYNSNSLNFIWIYVFGKFEKSPWALNKALK